jgi:AraC family transcriptional regulator
VTGSFSPETFARVTRHCGDWSELELSHCSDIRNVGIARTLHRLADEATAPGFGSAVMAEGLGLYLLVELARHFADLADAPARLAGLSSRHLQAVQDYVWDLKGKQPTLTDLAAMCGLGRRTFMRRFKASTGQTVSSWVAEQQMTRAKALLQDSALPLKQIAFVLGFSSAANFATAFRRSTGASPSACRRRRI